MCTTNVFTYVYPDGRKKTVQEPSLCHFSRRNQPCANNTILQHPTQYLGSPNLGMAAPYMAQMPPTPTYTPRTATPVYRSGDESDRSHHSGESSSRKRSSGVYINGQKVYTLDGHRRGSSSRRDRVVLVDSPQRTPPQSYPATMSAPSSPSAPYIISGSPRESPSSRRAVIVDDRGRETTALYPDPMDSASRRRHGSTSSRESRHSHTSDEDKEARRQRRREAAEALARQEKQRERIAKANARIANRPAVPAPPAPPVRRSSTMGTSTTAATAGSSPTATPAYVRPHVELHSDKDAELADAVRRLSFEEELREEKARKLERRDREREREGRARERNEDEAQRQRLMERLTPRRRSTVGHGSRRSRVLYDDGAY